MTTERPMASTETENLELQKFLSYLRGENTLSNSMSLPTSLSLNISNKLKTLSPIRSLAKVLYTGLDKLDVIVNLNTKPSSGWVSNTLIKSDTNVSVSKVSIYLHEVYSRPMVSASVLEDQNAQVEEVIQESIASQIAEFENYSFLYGDGITQPKGILKYDIVTSNYTISSKTIEGITVNDGLNNYKKLIELMDLLPSKYFYGASWLMSRNVASKLRYMQDSSSGKFIWQNAILPGTPDTLLGYPVTICDDMPKMLSKEELAKAKKPVAPILFGNFYEGYQIAERPGFKLLKDPFNSKPFVEFYATKRVGGDVVNHNAIKALVLN